MEAIFKKHKEVDMAGALLKSISRDERERAHFRSRRMFETDMESNRIVAEQRGEKRGIEIGEKRGEKRGIGIGEKRGIEIGEKRAETRRKEDRKKTAIAFKSKGIPVNDIVDAMKLTPDEIKAFGLRRKKS